MLMINKIAEVTFPTYWADFRLLAFEGLDCRKQRRMPETLLALVLGDLHRRDAVLQRAAHVDRARQPADVLRPQPGGGSHPAQTA